MSKLAKALTAAAGNAGGDKLYVEDVFSTLLYSDTYASSTVNGIDLADEGGLVWIKKRASVANHFLYDTERGIEKALLSNSTGAEFTATNSLTSFNSDGFSLGTYSNTNSGVAWTFRKAKKFFDVVTYTGNGTAGRTISHNLGSQPAVMIIKNRTTNGRNWAIYHGSLGNTQALDFTTGAAFTWTAWNSTSPTDSVFTVSADAEVNANGESFVAYLFASDAGGFGDDGDESIIKCGSFTADGSGNYDGSTDLGFEPQLILYKCSTAVDGGWEILDTMRGWSHGTGALLRPTTSDQEFSTYYPAESAYPVQNGFVFNNAVLYSNQSYVYIAIRRPMKTPESGAEVFTSNDYAGNGTNGTVLTSSNDPVDLGIVKRTNTTGQWVWSDRLRGGKKTLFSDSTSAETSENTAITGFDLQSGIEVGSNTLVNASASDYISYMFTRATGFFDVVAYSGNSTSGRNVAHNLGVAPEMLIVKRRTGISDWAVYSEPEGATEFTRLNATTASGATSIWNSTAPTSSVFTLGTGNTVNNTGEDYIAYLFATLAGVSKVGSYTGNGTTNSIDCGFSSGARFVMIKAVNDAGSWYVADSVRGIVAAEDPTLRLEDIGAEITNKDWIDPYPAGFQISATAGTSFNATGITYLFLAIA